MATVHKKAQIAGLSPYVHGLRAQLRDDRSSAKAVFEVGGLTVSIRNTQDSIWAIIRREKKGGLALRAVHLPLPFECAQIAAKGDAATSIIAGGGHRDKDGFFIEPTLIETTDPRHRLMQEELFGPVLTAWVYPDGEEDAALAMVDASLYALTGAIFSRDRAFIERASRRLRFAAGNFYINDKPTGAIVGQQPFGGARGSGTNDKAGSLFNLLRWISPRTIKETFAPPTAIEYPFMADE